MKVRVRATKPDGRIVERLLTERDGPHTICQAICGLTRFMIDSGQQGDRLDVTITVDEPSDRPADRVGGVASEKPPPRTKWNPETKAYEYDDKG